MEGVAIDLEYTWSWYAFTLSDIHHEYGTLILPHMSGYGMLAYRIIIIVACV